jgi:hypothetical protein
MDKKLSFVLWIFDIQFSTIVPLIGVLGACLFYFIDRYWYHRLLVGSVKHAIGIEKKYRDEIPELSLSDAIGKESPYKPSGRLVRFAAWLVVKEKRYRDSGNLHSDGKIELFYKSVVVGLLVLTVIVALMGGVSLTRPTQWNGQDLIVPAWSSSAPAASR